MTRAAAFLIAAALMSTLGPTAAHAMHETPSGGKGSKARWIDGVTITEYWPAPERWFKGKKVHAKGVKGRHRVDWLYSARGMSMEGDGVATDGQRYHVESVGGGGWVNADGKRTRPAPGRWTNGAPFWRAYGFWKNAGGRVTFPLLEGDWSRGKGESYVKPRGVSFGTGASLPLTYWRSLAVDPALIPRGSRVYIPAYSDKPGGGWFRAQDTGGAIGGRHVDVYRPPPDQPNGGRTLHNRRIYVDPQ